MIDFSNKRFYKKPFQNQKDVLLAKQKELEEKEKVLADKIKELEENKRMFIQRATICDDTIHEINNIHKLLVGNKDRIREAFESLQLYNQETINYLDNTIKTLEGNVSLLSIRLQSHRLLMNPSLGMSDMPIYINVYRKVEKIYKCLYEKRVEKNISINIIGNSYKEFKIKDNIELAIFIIIENAIKYSPANDEITIIFSEKNKELKVEFINWALCPRDEEMPLLIKRSFRSDVARSMKDVKGSGLGLYLLDQICKSTNVNYEISKGTERKQNAGNFYNQFIVSLIFTS